jgi:hypothetical protein
MFRKPFLHFKRFKALWSVHICPQIVWGCSGMDEFRLWRDRFCDLGTEGTEGSKREPCSHRQTSFTFRISSWPCSNPWCPQKWPAQLHLQINICIIYIYIYILIYLLLFIYKCKVL